MVDSVVRLTPTWVEDGFTNLIMQYATCIKLEIAYKYFTNPEEFEREREGGSYKQRIYNATNDSTGGAQQVKGVETLAEVIHALGVSGWLDAQTNWRRFGLITGFNMRSRKPGVLDPEKGAEKPGKWDEFFYWSEENQAYETNKSEKSGATFVTNIGGTPEGGSHIGAEKIAGDIETRNQAQGDYQPQLARQADGKLWKWPAYLQGRAALRGSHGRLQGRGGFLKPAFWGAGLMITNYYSDRSEMRTSNAGHFASPEYIEYLKLNPRALGETAAEALSGWREVLAQKVAEVFPGLINVDDADVVVSEDFTANSDPYPRWETYKGWDPSVEITGRERRERRASGARWVASPVDGVTRKQGSYSIPDSVAIWPTLPIETFPGGVYRFGGLPGAHNPFAGGTPPGDDPVNNNDYYTPRSGIPADAGKELIGSAWEQLYEAFKSDPGLPANGPLAGFDSELRESLFSSNKALLFGGAEGSDAYQAGLNTQIERIMDFFWCRKCRWARGGADYPGNSLPRHRDRRSRPGATGRDIGISEFNSL